MDNPIRKVRQAPDESELDRDYLKEQVEWVVDIVGRHRNTISGYLDDEMEVVDALRYFNQGVNKGRTLWLSDRFPRQSRHQEEVSYESELAESAIMGATALSLGQWPQVYSTDNVSIPVHIDDICTVAASSLDMWRWQGVFAHKDKELWWMDDVVRVIMGIAHGLGEEFRPEARHKLIELTYRWVDEQYLTAVWQDLDWLQRNLR